MGKRINDPSFPVQLPKMQKSDPGKSPDHLEFLASLGCVITGDSECVVHHLLITPDHARGVGRKSPDWWALPLTPKLHDSLHRHGNETRWFRHRQVEPIGLAATLWLLSGNREAALRAIEWLRR